MAAITFFILFLMLFTLVILVMSYISIRISDYRAINRKPKKSRKKPSSWDARAYVKKLEKAGYFKHTLPQNYSLVRNRLILYYDHNWPFYGTIDSESTYASELFECSRIILLIGYDFEWRKDKLSVLKNAFEKFDVRIDLDSIQSTYPTDDIEEITIQIEDVTCYLKEDLKDTLCFERPLAYFAETLNTLLQTKHPKERLFLIGDTFDYLVFVILTDELHKLITKSTKNISDLPLAPDKWLINQMEKRGILTN